MGDKKHGGGSPAQTLIGDVLINPTKQFKNPSLIFHCFTATKTKAQPAVVGLQLRAPTLNCGPMSEKGMSGKPGKSSKIAESAWSAKFSPAMSTNPGSTW